MKSINLRGKFTTEFNQRIIWQNVNENMNTALDFIVIVSSLTYLSDSVLHLTLQLPQLERKIWPYFRLPRLPLSFLAVLFTWTSSVPKYRPSGRDGECGTYKWRQNAYTCRDLRPCGNGLRTEKWAVRQDVSKVPFQLLWYPIFKEIQQMVLYYMYPEWKKQLARQMSWSGCVISLKGQSKKWLSQGSTLSHCAKKVK